MEKKFYNGMNDSMFKAIFCNPKNEELLKWLLEKCLKRKIEIVRVIPPEIIKPNIYVKGKTLDVLIKTDGELINVEVNSNFYDNLHIRNASYIFSKYSEETKVGEDYYNMRKVIQINFTSKLSNKYPIFSTYKLIDINSKIAFIENLIIYEYNVDKIKKECYNEGKKDFSFIAMLSSNKKELENICKGDDMMEKYEDEVNNLNEDQEFSDWISAEEDARKLLNTQLKYAENKGEKRGKKIGEKRGEKRGIQKNTLEIAKKMIKDELDYKTITKYTGLSKEELEKLAKE